MTGCLRLRAIDQDDLQIMAACLQDALIPLREMAFMADERRFMASFHRFQRERLADPDSDAGLSVCQSVLRVDDVEVVSYRGLDGDLGGVKFELLTVIVEPTASGGFFVILLFAGDVAIRLKVDRIAMTLDDFGDPWPASVAPQHDLQASPEQDG